MSVHKYLKKYLKKYKNLLLKKWFETYNPITPFKLEHFQFSFSKSYNIFPFML